MKAARGRAVVRFSKGPKDFPGGPLRISINGKKMLVIEKGFFDNSSIPLPLPKVQNQLTNRGFSHPEVCVSDR